MDGKRFDDLSKVLGASATRQSVFQLLAGIGATGLAALTGFGGADAKKGKGKGKGKGDGGGGASAEGKHKKGKGKGKGKNKKKDKKQGESLTPLNGSGECPSHNQRVICHCNPPDKPNKCDAKCRAGDEGHDGHPFDCACSGPFGNLPACEPGACSGGKNAGCCPNCPDELPDCCVGAKEGFCTNFDNDPDNCGDCGNKCDDDETCRDGKCEGKTCDGGCHDNDDCPEIDDCVCRFGGDDERTTGGRCGQCLADGEHTEHPSECCSNKYCERDDTCGECPPETCEGSCHENNDCPDLADCVCRFGGVERTTGGTCGLCVPNGEHAAHASECCSDKYCEETETCGECPPTCQGECSDYDPCPDIANCVCNKKQGSDSGTCGEPQTCNGTCENNGDCPDVENCVCNKNHGAESGTCGTPEVCEGTCANNRDCLNLDDCVCNKDQGAESGTCGTPQTCGGDCDNNNDCPDLNDCVCNKTQGAQSGTCGEPQTCGGTCEDNGDCPDLPDCVCNKDQGAQSGTCGTPEICEGECTSNAQCPDLDNCVCNKDQGAESGACGTPQTCGGDCASNNDCPDLDNCVCNKAQGAESGACGACVPKTCADFEGKCGPQPNGCGGQTASCTCPDVHDTCVEGDCICVPLTEEQACVDAHLNCGPVADGCGGDIDCGVCSGQQTCLGGVCKARGGKRCKGTGKAGHPCKGKKCKCKAGRNCHKGKCCETQGDGSRHCNANGDCCPGLSCVRKYPGQHKVCMRNSKKSARDVSASTATPSLALGAIVTGLLAKGVSRFFGSSRSDATVALSDMSNHVDQQEV